MENKAIVLENGFERDIPDELIEYLDDEKIEWEHYDTRFSFWPENRVKTMEFFSALPEGQLLLCHTVFDGFKQLELFINLLHKLLDKKFKFKIMHGCLGDDLMEFYNNRESSIAPEEYDDDDNFERAEKFKKDMNKKFLEVLACHDITWLKVYGEDILFKTLDDIINS